MAFNKEAQQAQAANPHHLVKVNELNIIFSNFKAEIPIYFVETSRDSVTAKFMYDGILIVQATKRWSNAATSRNFNPQHLDSIIHGKISKS